MGQPPGNPIANTSVMPSWVTSPVTLDLERLAETVVERLGDDPPNAVAFLKSAMQFVPRQSRSTMMSLVDLRLGPLTRGRLTRNQATRGLLFDLLAEAQRRPGLPRLPFFTPLLAYQFYASVLERYASAPAREDWRHGRLVLLALRKQSWTLANRGLGSYDDRIIVLRRGFRGGIARMFSACTEPGAQYSQRAAPAGPGKRVDANYASVKYHKSDGVDINRDAIKDAGRLAEGAYRFFEKRDGFLGARAFQLSATPTVERDTNGDGWFDRSDQSRLDPRGAGTSMYIHRGGPSDTSGLGTWSAGCQTIPLSEYQAFLAAIGGASAFFYVLVNMADR